MPSEVNLAMLSDLLTPVPGLASDRIDISTFTEVVFHDPAAPRSDARPRRPPRDFASLLAGPPRLPDSCAICLADFVDGEKLRALPCNGDHVFHPQCLARWLSRNPTCPCCRDDVQPKGVELDPAIAEQVLRSRLAAAGAGRSSAAGGRRSASAFTARNPNAGVHRGSRHRQISLPRR